MFCIGSFLSLFLGRDGGPREGAIRLPPEKIGDQRQVVPEEHDASVEPLEDISSTGSLPLWKRLSGRLSGHLMKSPSGTGDASVTSVPLLSSPHSDQQHRNIRSNRYGSAYGYSGSYRSRLASSVARHSMTSALRGRAGSYAGQQSIRDGPDLTFTQRLLMANENAVTNIADLWVAAAMNVDNEEEFDPAHQAFSEESEIPGREYGQEDVESVPSTPTSQGTIVPRRSVGVTPPLSESSPTSVTASRQMPRGSFSRTPALRSSPYSGFAMRHPSFGGRSIFSHPGVRAPSSVLNALSRAEMIGDTMAPIPEQSQPSENNEKPSSITSQLPIPIIVQYGLLALHSTTHDQVFLSYLVT